MQKAAPLFKHFVELAPLSPDAPSAYHQIALALVQRGDAEGATRVFEHAAKIAAWHGFYRARRLQIREHPSAPLPRLGLGQLLLEADQLDRARAVLEELVRVAPTFANGWFHLGECARKQQDLDAATRHYGKALELDPALDVARYNRAVIAVMQRRDPHARADLERIVEGGGGTDPRLINAHLELARLLARAGDPSGAKARHARYVELGGAEPLNP